MKCRNIAPQRAGTSSKLKRQRSLIAVLSLQSRVNSKSERLLVHLVLQSLTSLESRSNGCWNLNSLTSLRISAFSCSSVLCFKCSKTNQGNLFLCSQCFTNSLSESVQSLLGISLGQTSLRCHFCNQFCFIHINLSLKIFFLKLFWSLFVIVYGDYNTLYFQWFQGLFWENAAKSKFIFTRLKAAIKIVMITLD